MTFCYDTAVMVGRWLSSRRDNPTPGRPSPPRFANRYKTRHFVQTRTVLPWVKNDSLGAQHVGNVEDAFGMTIHFWVNHATFAIARLECHGVNLLSVTTLSLWE